MGNHVGVAFSAGRPGRGRGLPRRDRLGRGACAWGVRGFSGARGFTLVEILIVVVILGVLAAIVVPQFLSAAATARNNSLQMDLNRVRTQLEIYKVHHRDAWPSLAALVDQLTQSSNAQGATAAPGTSGYPLGPYVREFPVNPRTGTADVAAGAVGSSAWYYNENTGDFRANDSAESRAF